MVKKFNEAEVSREASKRNKNFRFFHSEAVAEATGDSASNYNGAFLVASGAGASSVALLSFLTNAASALLYIRVPGLIKRIGSTKKVMILLACLDSLGWVPIIAVLLLSPQFNLTLFILLWVINIVPAKLLECAKNYWLIDLGPSDSMARYMSMRAIIKAASYLSIFFVMAYLLQVYKTDGYFGFIIIFSMAFAAASASFAIYNKIHVSREKFLSEYDPKDKFNFWQCLKELGRGNLGKFILFASLLNFSVYLCAPYFQPYMLQDLQFSYTIFALVLASEFIGKIFVVRFWGKYADRAGRFKVLVITSLMIPFVPIFWLFSSAPVYLMSIQLFSGVAWAGFDLCSNIYVYESSPPGERLKYMAYHKAMTTFAMAMGALAGVYLLDVIRPIFGSQILSLFLLSGVLRLAAVGFGLFKMGQVHWDTLMTHHEKAVTMSPPAPVIRATQSRPSLYYRQEEWHSLLSGLQSDKTLRASQTGLYYRPNEWERYIPAARHENCQTFRQTGLYYCKPVATATLNKPRVKSSVTQTPSLALRRTAPMPNNSALARRFSVS
jgi:hypothetical protein